MPFRDLAVAILQEIGAVAVQDAGPAAGNRGRVLAAAETEARQLPHRRFRSPRSSRNGWNRPMALEPPPMQAISEIGSRFSASSICSRVSRPMIDWKSRTIAG